MKEVKEFAPPIKKKLILSYVKKYPVKFIITSITGLIFNTAIVLGPVFQGKLLDEALISNNMKGILKGGILFILVTLSFQIARFFKRYFVRDMGNRMSGDMRVGLLESILKTDLNISENQKVGDMMATTIGDVDIVVEAIRKTITEIWDTGVLMIAYFVTLMIYDVRITLIAAIPIPIVIILAQLMRKPVGNKSKEARKANSKTTTQIRKMISEVSILRLYGREEGELENLKERLSLQAKKTAYASLLKNGLTPLYSSFSTFGIIIVIGLGGEKVISGIWSIGTFTAYISLFIALATRTTTAAKVFNILQGSKASWERIKGLINDDEIENNRKVGSLDFKEISVKNLSFKYPGDQRDAVKDISFNVPSGSIVGVTGSVGSGKSALALALTGQYNYSGSITLDHREFRNIEGSSKLATISYLGHDPFLFSDTLENNITWGFKNERKFEKSIDMASLEEDIRVFPRKRETEVGERGNKVSGGQRQRISLARALYKDAGIVILDDPFSAVDVYTEEKIINKLRKNTEGKTIFIFSHRLESFKWTDQIIVLKDGKIGEIGTHEELLNSKGIYNKIVKSQRVLGVN